MAPKKNGNHIHNSFTNSRENSMLPYRFTAQVQKNAYLEKFSLVQVVHVFPHLDFSREYTNIQIGSGIKIW